MKVFLKAVCCITLVFLTTATAYPMEVSDDAIAEKAASVIDDSLMDVAIKGTTDYLKVETLLKKITEKIKWYYDRDDKVINAIREKLGKDLPELLNSYASLKEKEKTNGADKEEIKKGITEKKEKIAEAVKNATVGALKAVKDAEVPYETNHFILHAGVITLNPYTITRDSNNKFVLGDTGSTDNHFYTELLIKHRNAWWRDSKLYNEYKITGTWLDSLIFNYFDIDYRLGYVAGSKDVSAAVVAGSGDAYMEVSLGPSWVISNEGNNNKAYFSFNVEALGGLVTDRGSQSIHKYYGIGPLGVIGVPLEYKDSDKTYKRRIEALVGVYYGMVDMPVFVNESSREVETKNSYPFFRGKHVYISRADIHVPIGKSGFLVVTGRFYIPTEATPVNPWNLSIGYTIPLENILDSIAKIIKQ